MKSTFIPKYITILAAALSVAACSYENHFLDEEEPEPGTYDMLWNVKVSDYTWTYINLITGKTETHDDTSEWIYAGKGEIREALPDPEIGIEWHIAVHRYEFKTNGASVLNTETTDIMTVTELPAGTYTFDEVAAYETEKEKENGGYLLTMDMTEMMGGNIGYAHNPTINRALCDGITRTATGTMPPTIYDTKREIFVLKWADGSWIKLQTTSTKHTVKGTDHYLSFNYKYYPAE